MKRLHGQCESANSVNVQDEFGGKIVNICSEITEINAYMKQMVDEKTKHDTRVENLEARVKDADGKMEKLQSGLIAVVEQLKTLNQTLAFMNIGKSMENEQLGFTPEVIGHRKGHPHVYVRKQSLDSMGDGDGDKDPAIKEVEAVIATPNVSRNEQDSTCLAPIKAKVPICFVIS